MTDALDYLRKLIAATSDRKDANQASVFIGYLRDILAHVDAQAAEIEELRERCHEYAMALADKEQR